MRSIATDALRPAPAGSFAAASSRTYRVSRGFCVIADEFP
jgi:hypothetical protein